MPGAPGSYPRHKILLPEFDHPIFDLWNDGLCMKVVYILDCYEVSR